MKGCRFGKCIPSDCLWQLWRVLPCHHASFHQTLSTSIPLSFSLSLFFLIIIISLVCHLSTLHGICWPPTMLLIPPIYWNIIQLRDVASMKGTYVLKINLFLIRVLFFCFFPEPLLCPAFSISQFHGGPVCTCFLCTRWARVVASHVVQPEKLRLVEQMPRTMPVLCPGTAGDSA